MRTLAQKIENNLNFENNFQNKTEKTKNNNNLDFNFFGYENIVDNFIKNNPSWKKMENMDYTNYALDPNFQASPYNAPPILKIEFGEIIDIAWVDLSGKILSVKELLNYNKISEENLNFVLHTMFNEQFLGNTIIKNLRDFKLLNSEKEYSNSALRVKKNTLNDYPENIKEEFLQKLANFDIIKAQRSKKDQISKGFQKLYEIHGYKTDKSFIEDFKAGKISTNSEVGIALGIIIHEYFRDKIHLNDFKKGIINLENENFIYGKNSEKHNFSKENIDNVINNLNNPKKFNRLAPAYATDIFRAEIDTKQQVMLNLSLINAGIDKNITPDGDIGKGTKKIYDELKGYFQKNKINFQIYDKNSSEESKNTQKVSHEIIFNIWKKDLLKELNSDIKRGIFEGTEIKNKTKNKIKNSILSSGETQFIAYETLKNFYDKYGKKDLLAKTKKDFNDYIENGDFTKNKKTNTINNLKEKLKSKENKPDFIKTIDLISNPKLLLDEKNGGFTKEQVYQFQKDLIESIIIANEHIIETGFSTPLLFDDSITKNKTNSFLRATSFNKMIPNEDNIIIMDQIKKFDNGELEAA